MTDTTTNKRIRNLKNNKNKVTLVFPTTKYYEYPYRPSLGIGYLGSILMNNNIDVKCIDGNIIFHETSKAKPYIKNFVLNKILREVERTNPDILAVGSWTANLPFAAKIISKFRENNPDTLMVLGGYNSTFLPEHTFSILPELDILVRGEGEMILLELVKALNKGGNIRKVNGLVLKEKNKIIYTPKMELIKNLDEIPFINYKELFVKLDIRKMTTLPMITGRGCSFSCIFCSSRKFWCGIRQRSIKNIIEEIKYLSDEYDLKVINFVDDLFTLNKERVLSFSKLLPSVADIRWTFLSRLDTIDAEIIESVKKSGCSNIFYGLESVNPNTLRFINKTTNPEKYVKKAKEIIDFTHRIGIGERVSTIVGFPQETKEEIINTLNFVFEMRKDGIDSYSGLAICYPGTPLWEMYQKDEIKLIKIKDKKIRRNYSGFFSNEYEHMPECVPNAWMIKNEHVSNIEMEQIMRDFYFNRSPDSSKMLQQ